MAGRGQATIDQEKYRKYSSVEERFRLRPARIISIQSIHAASIGVYRRLPSTGDACAISLSHFAVESTVLLVIGVAERCSREREPRQNSKGKQIHKN